MHVYVNSWIEKCSYASARPCSLSLSLARCSSLTRSRTCRLLGPMVITQLTYLGGNTVAGAVKYERPTLFRIWKYILHGHTST